MLSTTRRTFLKTVTAGLAAAPYTFAQSAKISTAPTGRKHLSREWRGLQRRRVHRAGRRRNGGWRAHAECSGVGPGNSIPTKWQPCADALQHALASRTDRLQRATRHGGRYDDRPREHSALAQQNITWPWNGQKFKKLAKVAQPNKTFYDNGALDSGIRYGYISDAAHTDGDLYVYFPQQNILAVGDAAYGQGWPVVDWWTGGWIGGIVGGLQRIQTVANKETKIVPAQGPVLSFADIATQLDMYGAISDRLNQMLNKGHSPSEAVVAKPAKEYEAKMGNSDEFIRRAFESQWAYLSPDA